MALGMGYMPNKQERALLKQHHLVRAPHNKQIARIAWHFGAWERASVAIVALRRPVAGLKSELFFRALIYPWAPKPFRREQEFPTLTAAIMWLALEGQLP